MTLPPGATPREARGWSKRRKTSGHIRPLGLDCPTAHYRPSARRYRAGAPVIKNWDYLRGFLMQTVRYNGSVRFKGREIFFSEAFKGKQVAFLDMWVINPLCASRVTKLSRRVIFGRETDDERRRQQTAFRNRAKYRCRPLSKRKRQPNRAGATVGVTKCAASGWARAAQASSRRRVALPTRLRR